VKYWIRVIAAATILALATVAAFAQDTLSGKYAGVAKSAGAPDAEVTLELKNEGGKITGALMSGQTKTMISEGTVLDGKLVLKLGEAAKDGVLTAKLDGGTLVGDWVAGSQKKVIELKRDGGATATVVAAPVDINGVWEALADANGQPFPFTLTLKVEGEKVTGGSSSQLGESSITDGSWKEGKLAFQLNGQNGAISMSATIVEGKLSGEFDYSGQLQGKWVAVKKN
jgi:hypothetical protein